MSDADVDADAHADGVHYAAQVPAIRQTGDALTGA
jgi:hypothetical protein